MNIKFEYYINKDEIKNDKDDYSSLIPCRIKSKDELLKKLDKSLNLPDYFGENWDALYECLTDFNWIKEKTIIIIHEDIPLSLEKERKTYLEILNEAQNNWKEGEEHLLIIYFPKFLKNEIEKLLS